MKSRKFRNLPTEPTGLEFDAKISRWRTPMHLPFVQCTFVHERKKVSRGTKMHQNAISLSSIVIRLAAVRGLSW
jgi:hypothetical protein